MVWGSPITSPTVLPRLLPPFKSREGRKIGKGWGKPSSFASISRLPLPNSTVDPQLLEASHEAKRGAVTFCTKCWLCINAIFSFVLNLLYTSEKEVFRLSQKITALESPQFCIGSTLHNDSQL